MKNGKRNGEAAPKPEAKGRKLLTKKHFPSAPDYYRYRAAESDKEAQVWREKADAWEHAHSDEGRLERLAERHRAKAEKIEVELAARRRGAAAEDGEDG